MFFVSLLICNVLNCDLASDHVIGSEASGDSRDPSSRRVTKCGTGIVIS